MRHTKRQQQQQQPNNIQVDSVLERREKNRDTNEHFINIYFGLYRNVSSEKSSYIPNIYVYIIQCWNASGKIACTGAARGAALVNKYNKTMCRVDIVDYILKCSIEEDTQTRMLHIPTKKYCSMTRTVKCATVLWFK